MDEFDLLVVGLGNPGPEYERTRHNAGWLVLDRLHDEHGFSDWRTDKGSRALLSQGELPCGRTLLIKPETFMNNSGEAVAAVIKKNPEASLVVVHDEIDLPLGVVKTVCGRGSAGHKGVQSVIDTLKTNEFTRVRLGIAPVGEGDEPGLYRERAETFVLRPFKDDEEEQLTQMIDTAVREDIFHVQDALGSK